MVQKLYQINNFTGSTTARALAKNFCITSADTRSVCNS